MKKTTIYEIAAKAKLHPMTVSRALRPGTPVSPKTRKQVERIAKELGYRPNRMGAALRSGLTLEVGITYEALTRGDFSGVLAELNTRLTRSGYFMRMLEPHPESLTVRDLEQMNGEGMQGLILLNYANRDAVSWIAKRKLPSVWLIERPEAPAGAVHFFGSEDGPAARELLDHLHGLSHRRIAHLYGVPSTYGSSQRKQAYLDFMAERGLEPILEPTTFEPEGGMESIDKLLRRVPGVTAVLCSNDNTAVGAMFRLQQRGYRIPADISIVGFGSASSRHYEYFYPGLTTARHHHYELGIMAVDALVSLMEGRPPEPGDHLVRSEPVLRATTGRAPSAKK